MAIHYYLRAYPVIETVLAVGKPRKQDSQHLLLILRGRQTTHKLKIKKFSNYIPGNAYSTRENVGVSSYSKHSLKVTEADLHLWRQSYEGQLQVTKLETCFLQQKSDVLFVGA